MTNATDKPKPPMSAQERESRLRRWRRNDAIKMLLIGVLFGFAVLDTIANASTSTAAAPSEGLGLGGINYNTVILGLLSTLSTIIVAYFMSRINANTKKSADLSTETKEVLKEVKVNVDGNLLAVKEQVETLQNTILEMAKAKATADEYARPRVVAEVPLTRAGKPEDGKTEPDSETKPEIPKKEGG